MEDLQVSWKSITNANQTHMLQASVGMSDMRLPADNIRGRGTKLTLNLQPKNVFHDPVLLQLTNYN